MLVNILNDETNPIMEGLKIFTIEIKSSFLIGFI